MHNVSIRQHIVDRVMARRGRLHWFDTLTAARTALVVIDMQDTFCKPGAPAEVAVSRNIVEPINQLASRLREKGVAIFWVLHANAHRGERSDWEVFFNNVVSGEVRKQQIASVAPGQPTVWQDLKQDDRDFTVVKNRYSALISGSSQLEPMLRNFGIDTILLAGTKTNVCCESTGRDGMMLGFNTVMVSDCCAALSDEEHRATLETYIQQFGDVMTSDEIVERLV